MSKPNQWSPLGRARELDRLHARGSVFVKSWGTIATVTRTTINRAEMRNSGLRRSSSHASLHRLA
jgi:hypothetical protein